MEQVCKSEGCFLRCTLQDFGVQGRHVALEAHLREKIRKPQTLSSRPSTPNPKTLKPKTPKP